MQGQPVYNDNLVTGSPFYNQPVYSGQPANIAYGMAQQAATYSGQPVVGQAVVGQAVGQTVMV